MLKLLVPQKLDKYVMLCANLFLGRRGQILRKKNSMEIRLPIPFKENIKILIITSTVSIYPKSTLKHQKPTPKLQTPNELKCLKALRTDST